MMEILTVARDRYRDKELPLLAQFKLRGSCSSVPLCLFLSLVLLLFQSGHFSVKLDFFLILIVLFGTGISRYLEHERNH